jgi:hypothetical protein
MYYMYATFPKCNNFQLEADMGSIIKMHLYFDLIIPITDTYTTERKPNDQTESFLTVVNQI